MFITIKLSGIVKPSPTFEIVSRPISTNAVIQSLSHHLKQYKILIPLCKDFYELFYYEDQVQIPLMQFQQKNDKLSNITFYKLKLIKYEPYEEKAILIRQFQEFLSQQNKRIEDRFKTLINDQYNKTQQNQQITPKLDDQEKNIIRQLKLDEESKYYELKEMQEQLKQLQLKQQNNKTKDLQKEIQQLNLQIEQQFEILDKLQDYCLQINIKVLSKEQYKKIIQGETKSSRQQQLQLPKYTNLPKGISQSLNLLKPFPNQKYQSIDESPELGYKAQTDVNETKKFQRQAIGVFPQILETNIKYSTQQDEDNQKKEAQGCLKQQNQDIQSPKVSSRALINKTKWQDNFSRQSQRMYKK